MSSGQQATRTQGAGPVVICCAAADAGAIATVARELQADGHTVEVVAGVETDPRRLAPVIDRCRGEGLYVLCRSRALGRDAVDELRDVLLARHVPFGRTLTVASTRPRELRERIVASLSRVAAGVVRKMANVPPEGANPTPRVRRTTQLGIPSPIAQPKPEARPEPTAAEKRKRNSTQLGIPVAEVARLAQEMRAKADAPLTPSPEVSPEPAPPSAAEETSVDTNESFEDEEPTNTRMRAPRSPMAAAARDAIEAARAPDEPPTEPLAKAMSREEILAAAGESDPETETLEFAKLPEDKPKAPRVPPPPPPPPPKAAAKPTPAAPIEDSVARAAVITADELADLGGTDPRIQLSAPRAEDDFDAMPVRSGDTKVQTLIEAGLVGVRSGDTAIVHVDDVVRSGATVRVPAVPLDEVPRRTEISSAPPPVVKERSAIMLPAMLAGGALLIGIIAAIALTGDDDDDAEDAVAKKSDAAAKKDGDASTKSSGGDTATPSEDGDEGGAPDAAVGATRTKVGEALRSREVQALDVLLVTSKSFGPFDFAAAQAHCAGLEIAGLDGWRLPDIGELMSLASAGMTGGGYYWSSTAADTFGDVHLVWYGKRARVLEREKPNYVTCVRGSVGDP